MTGHARLINRSSAQALLRWSVILFPSIAIRIVYGRMIAGQPYFAKYLTLARDLFGSNDPGPFTSSPVYIVIVAFLTRVLDLDPDQIRLVQFLTGIISIILIVKIGTVIYGRTAGTVAGIIAALFGPAVLYEGDLVTASWVVLLSLTAVRILLIADQRPGYGTWIPGGIITGLLAGIRPTLILLIVLGALFGVTGTGDLSRRWKRIAAFLAGAAVVIAPVTLANYIRCGELIPVTASGGSVFYSSNNFRAVGLGYSPPEALTELEYRVMQSGDVTVPVEHRLFKYLAERASGRRLTYGEVSKFYFREGLNFLLRDIPGGFRLWVKKGAYFFNGYEVHDTASLIHAKMLMESRLPFLFGFGFLWVAGSTGILIGTFHFRRWLLMMIFLIPHWISGIVFYVNGRLRLPAAPFLIIFSAYAVVRLCGDIRKLHPRAFLILVWVLGATGLINLDDDALRWHREMKTPSFYACMEGTRQLNSGDFQGASKSFYRAIKLDPLGAREAHSGLAAILMRQGNRMSAELENRHAAGIWTAAELIKYPPRYETEWIPHQMALAAAYWRENDLERAARLFEKIRDKCPQKPDPEYNLAVYHMSTDPPDRIRALASARRALELGMKLDLHSTRAHVLINGILEDLGRDREALEVRKQIEWERSFIWGHR
ncbi:glycosyltransferase family 39 protein [bacterium]|nr:glycosyltransferase family 39 protein [candidate division CSSED10-310 bacterium]